MDNTSNFMFLSKTMSAPILRRDILRQAMTTSFTMDVSSSLEILVRDEKNPVPLPNCSKSRRSSG